MIKRFITSAPEKQQDSHRALLRSVVLCALMGNFNPEAHDVVEDTPIQDSSHTPRHQVIGHRWRHLLRAMDILAPNLLTEFVLTVQRLVLAGMRAAIIWAVAAEPVYEMHVERLCNWKAFVQSSQECLQGIRRTMDSFEPGTVEQLIELTRGRTVVTMENAVESGIFPGEEMTTVCSPLNKMIPSL